MTIPSRSLRLTPKNDYTRFTGNRGEIFYDPVNNTLRVFDSQLAGGHIVATRSWVTTQLPSVQGLASVAYVNQAVAAIPEYLLKITADDSTVLAVGRDETLQVRGQGSVTTTISTDSTGIQLVISAPEVSNNNIDVNAPLGSASLVPTERAVKAYADLLFNLQTQQLLNGTLDITAASLQFNSGVAVGEFSNDPTFVDNSSSAVPTESAVRSYIDRRLGNDADGQGISPVNKIGPQYVITTGQQTLDLSAGRVTSDGDATFNADGVMLASWIASLTTTRSLNIVNLTAGRFMKIYVRNTNGSSRIVQVNASATADGLAAVNLAAGAGAVSVSQITLAATSGSAVITVWNTGSGTIVGMVN